MIRTAAAEPPVLPLTREEYRAWVEAQPRGRTDIVAAANLGKRLLAPVAALDRLALLMRGELRRSAHFLPARYGPRSTFAGGWSGIVLMPWCRGACVLVLG